MSDPMLFSLRGVFYRQILSIDALDIPAEKTTFVVGPSGCGKTTLLRLLALLSSPDCGEIRYFGKPLALVDSVEHRRQTALVPQQSVLYPGSVRDNLLIGPRFAQKAAPNDTLLADTLSIVGLQKALDCESGLLSGGERQRLCLARALLIGAQTYLLDEPTAALDAESAHTLLQNIRRLAQESRISLIVVTHAQDLADQYADYVVSMQAGAVVRVEDLQ